MNDIMFQVNNVDYIFSPLPNMTQAEISKLLPGQAKIKITSEILKQPDIKLMTVDQMRAYFKGGGAQEYAATNKIAVKGKSEIAACKSIHAFYSKA
jgi:hypothetical protein